MKRNNKWLLFTLLIFVFTLFPKTALAKDFPTMKVHKDKIFSVKFNDFVDETSITNNIIVQNDQGEMVNVTLQAEDNVVKVLPPYEGYLSGKYTLKVNDKLKSTDNKKIKESAQLKFEVVNSNLKVHYIDVEQGDSTLIQIDDKNILIDAGPGIAKEKVVSYLKEAGVSKLDYVIATHPHEDHIGNMADIIDSFEIGEFIAPKAISTTKSFENMIKSLKAKNLQIKTPNAGDKISLGAAQLEIIAPNNNSYQYLNNYSIVTKLKYGNRSFIFTGDAESISEGEILAKQLDLSADVLKVGHHGSKTSTTDQFLKAINPKYAVISVGKDNNYGHPDKEVLYKLANNNTDIFRTDKQGTIVAESDGNIITFNTDPDKNDTIVSEIEILSVDLEKEIVEIKNNSGKDVEMKGWKIISTEGNQSYAFPSFILKANSTVYITSGKDAKEDGLSYLKWTTGYIWNNSGDTAELYDSKGNLISRNRVGDK
ncbi:MBL fold metallo-hydrolase [Clostridium algidicarnis]|uniref:MBL fold metallo-hydrolase n=1 Tax=Clostridium algidicarnis TaxID=37659 RepID=UPI001CF2987F|nr:MBL fold metallo-hydrolase [Clostridium algidicarnis]MCB2285730.1 MBL fold metallo-hydrolase [Clostridium algidicarnis]